MSKLTTLAMTSLMTMTRIYLRPRASPKGWKLVSDRSISTSQSSGILFHMLMSSELLGLTEPDHAIYLKAVERVSLPLEDCWMFASHLYDFQVAKGVGMKMIYVHRTTEGFGVEIDLDGEHLFADQYCDGRDGSAGHGFLDISRELLDINAAQQVCCCDFQFSCSGYFLYFLRSSRYPN
ncbi:uncharacterized protein BDR25DRAFT_350200 [Lindgomyces ingoldianus]|uniref:Uncharacterized protein n=1 Tax=Lindgomyces ingoldianus TaxID=673940 RepID=A0ACB6RA41_9PLEO|nr:uncharacterized protein BDR25DRAFT_350200 [Lindgomyces ingoldianus]KAF2475920.1 hypothetical protein BDR25DRAFT_350200 [Lindgomyces ingoldianus]